MPASGDLRLAMRCLGFGFRTANHIFPYLVCRFVSVRVCISCVVSTCPTGLLDSSSTNDAVNASVLDVRYTIVYSYLYCTYIRRLGAPKM